MSGNLGFLRHSCHGHGFIGKNHGFWMFLAYRTGMSWDMLDEVDHRSSCLRWFGWACCEANKKGAFGGFPGYKKGKNGIEWGDPQSSPWVSMLVIYDLDDD